MAYAQIKQYGMDEVIGPLSFPTDEEVGDNFLGKKPYSKRLARTIDEVMQYCDLGKGSYFVLRHF